MTQFTNIPDPEKFKHGAEKLREACLLLDSLNLILDDAISQIETENHRHPLYVQKLQRAKSLVDSCPKS
jgi:hypothetical protein